MNPEINKKGVLLAQLLVGVFFASTAFAGYKYYEVKTKNDVVVSVYETKINEVTQQAEALKIEKEDLTKKLEDSKSEKERLEKILNRTENKVEKLTKLTETDPQLLLKYSKVFFLSENYKPAELESIDKKYLSTTDKNVTINASVYPFLQDMLDEAEEDGVSIKIVSGYRSFQEQKTLKTGYSFTYGAGTANQFSAEQGYSEHQIGTTLDFTSSVGGSLDGFDGTKAYAWLLDNAYNYGFVISYPKGNTYYQYEPWHWRFVGRSLAKKLHRDNKFFYDMDQREISNYLVKIFD